MIQKVCGNCKDPKPLDCFHNDSRTGGKRSVCKICHSKKRKKHYQDTKDHTLIKNKEWRQKNKGRMAELMAIWRIENPSKNKEAIQRQREKDRQDPLKMLKKCLRQRLLYGLNGKTKNLKTLQYLGCSIEELKFHLEVQFKEGMTWDNRGKGGWEIDHIIPMDSFDLSDEEDIHKCCHFSNLQPLWKTDNLRKGNKIINGN